MSEKNLIRSLLVGSFLCFLGALGLFFKSGSNSQSGSAEEIMAAVEKARTQKQDVNPAPYTQAKEEAKVEEKKSEEKVEKKTENRLNEKEQASVNTITKMLRAAVAQDISTKSFIELVKTTGLKPVASTNKDPDSNGLTTVRASNSLEGTRYFHAQFFAGDKIKDFPQHLSFEIRPSANSMEIASQMIETNFKGSAKLVETRADYKRWKTSTGQVIWAKVLDEEDVMESPINPRDKNDIGTVWVAIEHEIHDEDDGHEH